MRWNSSQEIQGWEGWGVREFASAEPVVLELGPLSLWLSGTRHEWLFRWKYDSDSGREVARVAKGKEPEASPDLQIARFATSRDSAFLRLYPSLADRNILVRPEIPTWLPPEDEVSFFITTPLWITLENVEGVLLFELPTFRPSDTWFGTLQDGELCYAGRMAALLDVDQIPVCTSRATTKVTIRNGTQRSLLIERLNLPVALLSVYQDEEGRFWTESVAMVASFDEVQVRLSHHPPDEAKKVVRVVAPRIETNSNVLIRAFHRLLG